MKLSKLKLITIDVLEITNKQFQSKILQHLLSTIVQEKLQHY